VSNSNEFHDSIHLPGGSSLRTSHILAVAAALAGAALAATIDSQTAGNNFVGNSTNYWGESFTTPGGGPWSNIGFNFYSDIPATTPAAAGTAFMLSEEYGGTPLGLSSSTPGFLAASTSIVSGQFIFDPSLVLQPDTQYFLYANTPFSITGTRGDFSGQVYFTTSTSQDFTLLDGLVDANFLVSGNAIASVPEPSNFVFALPALGLFLLWQRRWRRRAHASAKDRI
jgi:MYXO-CTERM domain-containing protein